ncbi:DUF4367 domain-containing protein [Paenibacillus sp. 7541]|uniref:DUF4367 domain-containing protein n=1 Tax=Paenibacillus TaxID=44249 RepID=UPI000BA5496D|nr:DUF4367 domain-containing protein [Paenibacillus sp. 7541]PAK51608.1 hypothetical protein CHH75_13595 [Paenibacillus sp. 7541]
MSNEKYEGSFDEQFDQAFERAASRSSIAADEESKRQSWQQVKQQLDQLKRKKQRRRRFRLTGIVAASVAIGAFLFSPPTMTQAVTPFYQQIKNWGDGVVNMMFGRQSPAPEHGAVTAPPPDMVQHHGQSDEDVYVEELTTEYHHLTEAQIKERLAFPLPEFGYMPEGYVLDEMSALGSAQEEPVYDLALHYANGDQRLYVHLYSLDNSASVALPGEVTSQLKLDSGIEAAFSEGRYNSLKFMMNEVVYFIIGDVSKEELVKIANNIQ